MSGVADVAERHLPDPAWSVARPFWEGCRAGELRIHDQVGDRRKLR